MKYRIKKVLLNNFKCLKGRKCIEFNSDSLIVLTGPNGYGKTTIFDALEIIFAGNVARIKEISSTSNKNKMGNLLLNNTNEDGFVGVELINDKKELVTLITKIDHTVSNERKLKNSFKHYYFKNNLEQALSELEKSKPKEKGKYTDLLYNELGIKSEHYNSAYYVSQEETFSYLSKSEGKKGELFTKLIDIQDEKDKLKIFEDLSSKQINNWFYKKASKLEENIKEEYKKLQDTIEESQYIRLFKEIEIEWDKEKFEVKSKNSIEEIRKIQIFTEYYSDFKTYQKNKKPKGYLQNKELINTIAYVWTHVNEKGIDFKIIKDKVSTYTDFQIVSDFKNRIEKNHISEILDQVDLNKIKEILSCDFSIEGLISKIEAYNLSKKESDKSGQVLNNIANARDRIIKQINKNEYEYGDCPLCGWSYSDKGTLIKALDSYKEKLDELLKIKAKRLIDLNKDIDIILNPLIEKISNYIENNKDSVINKETKEKYDNAEKLEKQLAEFISWSKDNKVFELINIKLSRQEGDINKKLVVENIIKEKIEPLEHTDFDFKFKENNLEEVYKNYFKSNSENEDLKTILADTTILKIKENYLLHMYNKYNKVKVIKPLIKELLEKAAKYRFLYKKSDEIKDIYSNAIADFTKTVIQKIEVPLCLYCAKILLNYQRGLGIFIKTDEDCKHVTFVPDVNQTDHDIINTFSSGQLTAFVISFLLVLNEANRRDDAEFLPIMIDDPVQTMDDINYISLIAMLKNSFSQKQVIMSTHEGDKANYIRYKYLKAGHKSEEINVREKFNE